MCQYCTEPASDVLIDADTDTISQVCARHTSGAPTEPVSLRKAAAPSGPSMPAPAPSGIYWREVLHRTGLVLLALAGLALCLGLFAWMLSTFSLPLMHSLSSVMSLTMVWAFGIGMSALLASLFAPR